MTAVGGTATISSRRAPGSCPARLVQVPGRGIAQHRYDDRREALLAAHDLEPGVRVQERLEGAARVAPVVPRQLVRRPGVVRRGEHQPALAQHPVDLEHDLPGHREVLERGDRVHGVERPLDHVRERVRVADDVDVRARENVEPDVLAVAVQPGADVRVPRSELEHARGVERVRRGQEVGVDRVVGVARAVALQRSRSQPDEPDQRGAAAALQHLAERSRHQAGGAIRCFSRSSTWSWPSSSWICRSLIWCSSMIVS